MIFNCFGVLAALPFTNLMAKGMMWLIPDKAPEVIPASVRVASDPGACSDAGG